MVPAVLAPILLSLLCAYAQPPPGGCNMYSDTTCCTSRCVFNGTTESDILKETDLECDPPVYDQPYSAVTTLDEIMTFGVVDNISEYQYVLVGAKDRSSTSEYVVAAVGRYRDIFHAADLVSGDLYAAKQGLGPYAAYWYRVDQKSFGFAPSEPVTLGLADTYGLPSQPGESCQPGAEHRLSWQLDNGLDGWRAGCHVGHDVYSWRKIVKLCRTTRYGEKTGVQLMQYKPEFMSVYRANVWQSLNQSIPTIKIGTAVTLDCTSERHFYGLMFRRTYTLFVEWVNTVRGGVNVNGVRRPIELILMGDRSEPSVVSQVTNHLLAVENVRLFLGPYGSALTAAAADLVQTNGGTMVATVATATSIFKNRSNIFGVYMPSVDNFGRTVTELASLNVTKIAYVRSQTFPSACTEGIESMASAHGIAVTWSHTFESSDIAGHLDALEANLTTTNTTKKAEALLGCVYQAECEQIIQAIIDRQIDVNAIVMTVCLGSPTWLSRFGENGRFIGGTTPWLASMGFNSQVSNWSSYDFAAAYEESYNSAPSYHAALCWAAGIALMVAIESAGSTDPDLVRDALQTMDINETVFGAIKFSADGLNTNPWKTVQYLPGVDSPFQVIPEQAQKYVYPIPPWRLRECFIYNSISCIKGLRNGECITCPDEEGAVWSQTDIGNNMGCVCLNRQCSPGEILNVSNTVDIQCYACDAGKYPAASGECEPCPVGTYANTPKTATCHECAAGTVNNLTGQTACVACPPGSVSYTAGEQFCTKCRRGTNSSKSGSSSCTLCAPGTVAENEGVESCHDCPRGTQSIWGGYVCANCSVGKFQSQPRMSSCKDCPLGTVCNEEATTSPDNAADWWRYHNLPETDAWIPCPEEGICLPQERCAEGQTDFLCGVCLPGYARGFDSAKCHKCPARGSLIALSLFGIIVMMIGTIFVSSVAVKAALKSRAITDALLKLLFNYFTTISVTTGILQIIYLKKIEEDALTTGKMPKQAQQWIFWLLSFSLTEVIVPVLQLECFFDYGSLTAEENAYVHTLTNQQYKNYFDPEVVVARTWLQDFHWDIQFKVMIFWFLGPPCMLLFILVVLAIILNISLALHRAHWKEVNELVDAINLVGYQAARKGKDKHHCLALLESVEHKLFGIYSYYKFAEMRGFSFAKIFLRDSEPIFIVALFLIFPTLVQMFLGPLWCTEPSHGLVGHVRSKFYNLKCYDTSDALFWMSTIGLFVLCIGVPVFAGYKILFSGRTKRKGDAESIADIQTLRFLRTWSFLMAGYENGKEYWECIVLFRKSVTVILAAISIHDGARVLALLIIASSFSLLHIVYRPFDNRFDELLDRVENRHLLVWILFCLAILWIYLSSNLSANKVARELTGSTYTPEDTTLYIAAGFMCFLHFLFVTSLLYSILEHAAMAHADYLVHLAEKRHHLQQHHPDTGEESLAVKSEALSETSMGTQAAMMARISKFVHAIGNDNLRQEYQAKIEKKWFGSCAHWYYDVSMDAKAHILCDARNMWFTLMGARSHKCKPSHEVDKKLSEKKLPALAMPANEDQRRYLLKIIMEAMQYVIVTLEIPIIPASLLEFVLRCGFTFQSMGELRMAGTRESTHDRTNNMARLVAAKKLEDASDGQWATTNSLLRASQASGYGEDYGVLSPSGVPSPRTVCTGKGSLMGADVQKLMQQFGGNREVAEFTKRSMEGVWCDYFRERTNEWVKAVYSLVEGAERFTLLTGEKLDTKEVVCHVTSIHSVKSIEMGLPADSPKLEPGNADRLVMVTYDKAGQLTRFYLLEESASARAIFVHSLDAVVKAAKDKAPLMHSTSSAASAPPVNKLDSGVSVVLKPTIPPTPQSVQTKSSYKSDGRTSDGGSSKASTFHQVIKINSDAREKRMKSEYLVLADDDIRSLVKEMFAPDIFMDALSLEDFQLNLTMLRKTNRQNMLRWLAIFDEECIYHRALRVQGMLETRKTFRLEMQKMRSEKHREKKQQREEESKSKGRPRSSTNEHSGSMKEMKKFTREISMTEDDSSRSSSDSDEMKEDSDNEFNCERDTQTEFDNKCNLADLNEHNLGIETELAIVSGALGGDMMKRYDSDLDGDNPIHQKWVLFCANIIHMADEQAAKLPATYAYGRCKKREEETTREVKEIMAKMEEVRKALAVARDAKRPDAKTFMRQEREDLECTRAAIEEAEAEVEALKQELEELKRPKKEPTHASASQGNTNQNGVKLPSAHNASRDDAPNTSGSAFGNLRLCAMPACGMTGR